MMSNLSIDVIPAVPIREEVLSFYHSLGRITNVELEDHLVIARAGPTLVGAVRLCHEENVFVLRTMQIHPDLQRKGIGEKILKRFDLLLHEKGIQEIYCLPYAHLEDFYGMIGFRKITVEEAPSFLQNRLSQLTQKYPEKTMILMKRG